MTSESNQAYAVVEQLRLLFEKKPFFKSVGLSKDDAGLHVEIRAKRDGMPKEGLHVGVVNGVRVCVVVHD